jgi:hypothetical protein
MKRASGKNRVEERLGLFENKDKNPDIIGFVCTRKVGENKWEHLIKS